VGRVDERRSKGRINMERRHGVKGDMRKVVWVHERGEDEG
jgi:hypothetical protein